MSSNLRVTSSNPRVTSSNPRATRFFFHHFNTKRCAVLLNYYCQALSISPYGINGGLSDNSCSSVPFASALSPPWYLVQPNSHIKKSVIPEHIVSVWKCCFHFNFLPEIKKMKSGVINFVSQRNFKQTFV